MYTETHTYICIDIDAMMYVVQLSKYHDFVINISVDNSHFNI